MDRRYACRRHPNIISSEASLACGANHGPDRRIDRANWAQTNCPQRIKWTGRRGDKTDTKIGFGPLGLKHTDFLTRPSDGAIQCSESSEFELDDYRDYCTIVLIFA